MAVLNPLRVVIDNYPDGQVEEMEAINNQENPDAGTRKVPFSKIIYIERDDFMENPPKKFFRLSPGTEVRLMHAYYITCTEVIKNDNGEIVEIHCTYDPETRGGGSPDGRKVKGTLHWVSAAHALDAEVRLYEYLFTKENPNEVDEPGQDFIANINPHSLQVLTGCKVEPYLQGAKAGSRYQFLRNGYFAVDPDSTGKRLVFNRAVSLRDTWAKIVNK
jgi:glutaminyl-tRNA synthetase